MEKEQKKTLSIPSSIETIGEAIYWCREQRCITLRRLAQELGVSPPFMSDIEHNRKDIPHLIPKLAAILDVKKSQLGRLNRFPKSLPDVLKKNPWIVVALRNRSHEWKA